MRRKWAHGRQVVNGVLRYASVSAIDHADNRTATGCLRAWHYEKVVGRKKGPEGKAQKRGISGHDEIAGYLRTGIRNLSNDVLKMMHILPDPGDDLLVNHDILLWPGETTPVNEETSAALLARAPLRIGGVPLIGELDCTHARGTNKGTTDIESAIDPPGTIEVIDWKFTSGMDRARQDHELPSQIQMAGYGEWTFVVEPEATFARLSHGYFPEKGVGRKATIRVDRDAIRPTLDYAAGIVREMQDVAGEQDPDKVPANVGACRAFHKDCPHLEVCKAGQHNALAEVFGDFGATRVEERAAGSLIEAPEFDVPLGRLNRGGNMGISILKKVAPTGAAVGAPAIGVDAAAAVAAERAKLEAEEKSAKAARERAEFQMPAGFAAAVAAFEASGYGMPMLAGAAAKAYAHLKGIELQGGGYAGSGRLGKKGVSFSDPADVVEASGELADLPPAGDEATELEQLQDEQNNAAVAARDVTARAESTYGREQVANPGPGILPPGTPEPTKPAHHDARPTPAAAVVPDPVEARPPENPIGPIADAAEGKKPAKRGPKPKPAADAGPSGEGASPDDGLYIFVDTLMPLGVAVKSLNPYVDQLMRDLAIEDKSIDVRASSPEAKLGFGRWKGALFAATNRFPPAAGAWVLSTRGNEPAQIVAQALMGRATLYVQGA